MWVVFWMHRDATGALLDSFLVLPSKESAMRHARKLAKLNGIYTWGVAPIARASEPHWEGGAQ